MMTYLHNNFFNKIILIFSLLLVCGCSVIPSNSSSTTNPEIEENKAEELAANIVSDLKMENMTKLKNRTMLGLFLAGDKSLSNDYAGYLSDDSGNANTVAVIYTSNVEQVTKYVQSFLDDQESNVEMYYPSEVFKVSNAILANNDTLVILIIADDIEEAKTIVQNVIN